METFEDFVREVFKLVNRVEDATETTMPPVAMRCLADNLVTAVVTAADGVLSESELFVLAVEAEHGGPVYVGKEAA